MFMCVFKELRCYCGQKENSVYIFLYIKVVKESGLRVLMQYLCWKDAMLMHDGKLCKMFHI